MSKELFVCLVNNGFELISSPKYPTLSFLESLVFELPDYEELELNYERINNHRYCFMQDELWHENDKPDFLMTPGGKKFGGIFIIAGTEPDAFGSMNTIGISKSEVESVLKSCFIRCNDPFPGDKKIITTDISGIVGFEV